MLRQEPRGKAQPSPDKIVPPAFLRVVASILWRRPSLVPTEPDRRVLFPLRLSLLHSSAV